MRTGDIVDRANEHRDRELESQIERVRSQITVKRPYTGTCHYCYEDVPHPHTFCVDLDCRDMFELEQEARKRNGTI